VKVTIWQEQKSGYAAVRGIRPPKMERADQFQTKLGKTVLPFYNERDVYFMKNWLGT
jgi:hypothetical protein